MARAELAALPNELLYMLSEQLSMRDLNALLSTSRHMHLLFNKALYRLAIREKGNAVLFWACLTGRPGVVSRCLALGASAEAGCSAAAPDGTSAALARQLQTLVAGADPPLFCAVEHGHPEVVAVLLDHGVDFERRSRASSLTPLEVAARDAKKDVLRLLISRGAAVNQAAPATDSPLHTAVRAVREHGRLDAVRILLEAKADVNATNADDATPLHAAPSREAADLLIDWGAHVAAADRFERTPLSIAIREKRDHLWVKMLLKADAPVNKPNSRGETPIFFVSTSGTGVHHPHFHHHPHHLLHHHNLYVHPHANLANHPAAAATLPAAANPAATNPANPADGNANGSNNDGGDGDGDGGTGGGTAGNAGGTGGGREQARISSNVEIARVLINHGADLAFTDIYGSTPLHQVCYDGDEDTVRLFLERGSKAACRNRKGLTPLHIAAEHGHPGLVALLLAKGANVNATNYYRSTPLHRMASIPKRKLRVPGNLERFVKVLETLLDAKADLNRQDRIGQTPLMKASYHGYWRFVEVMIKRDSVDLTIRDRRGKMAAQLAKECGPDSRTLTAATEAAVARKNEVDSVALRPTYSKILAELDDQAVRDGIRDAVKLSVERGIDQVAGPMADWDAVRNRNSVHHW